MGRPVYNADEELTLLKRVLQLHGEFRSSLESIRVTPLQAGVFLFLRRHAEANVTDAATALRVRVSTLSEVVNDLVRKRWVTECRPVTDSRVVHVRLTRRGTVLTCQIERRVGRLNTWGFYEVTSI